MPTRSGWWGRSSTRSRSRAGARISTSAGSICRQPASGVHRPNAGRLSPHADLGASTTSSTPSAIVLTLDNRALRDVASAAPYEFLEILVNDKTYGGGGIFNDQATASRRQRVRGVRVRARVRTSLRGAGGRVLHVAMSPTRPAAQQKPEPWEPNVTALHDPGAAEVGATSSRLARRCRRRGTRTRSRSTHARDPERARATFARATRRSRRWTSSSRERDGVGHEVPVGHAYLGGSRRVRRCVYEREGPLSAAGRLHHVHAAIRSASAASAVARSNGSSICTRGDKGTTGETVFPFHRRVTIDTMIARAVTARQTTAPSR